MISSTNFQLFLFCLFFSLTAFCVRQPVNCLSTVSKVAVAAAGNSNKVSLSACSNRMKEYNAIVSSIFFSAVKNH